MKYTEADDGEIAYYESIVRDGLMRGVDHADACKMAQFCLGHRRATFPKRVAETGEK